MPYRPQLTSMPSLNLKPKVRSSQAMSGLRSRAGLLPRWIRTWVWQPLPGAVSRTQTKAVVTPFSFNHRVSWSIRRVWSRGQHLWLPVQRSLWRHTMVNNALSGWRLWSLAAKEWALARCPTPLRFKALVQSVTGRFTQPTCDPVLISSGCSARPLTGALPWGNPETSYLQSGRLGR